jgi:hypothetical protein
VPERKMNTIIILRAPCVSLINVSLFRLTQWRRKDLFDSIMLLYASVDLAFAWHVHVANCFHNNLLICTYKVVVSLV